jgi:hypothetical protein
MDNLLKSSMNQPDVRLDGLLPTSYALLQLAVQLLRRDREL